ncbi:MAG: PilZ domain-containing protein [Nitrospirae bacterium]|nr:PilZ domain-containing protein [Nitrospirota bacterium]
MEDRRRNRRIRMVSHLEVKFPDNGSSINAFTTNVSREGLGFCTGKEIEEGRNIEVKIYLDQPSNKQVIETLTGRIQWVKQISRIYEAGVRFADSDLRNHPFLSQHVTI